MNPAIHEESPTAFGLMARVLDEIDHGLLLVDLSGRIVHANHPARRELAAARALRNVDGMLGAGQALWQARIRQALKDAERGCRSIIETDFLAALQATTQYSLAGGNRLTLLDGGGRTLAVLESR